MSDHNIVGCDEDKLSRLVHLFTFLKSPHTVATFQKYCGILPAIDTSDNKGDVKEKSCFDSNGSNSSSKSKDHKHEYTVNNKFLYYLFHFGASLGNEIFYITFFPFWFWNVDGYVGRRMCTFWAVFMYFGQAAKDVIRLPRPQSPPRFSFGAALFSGIRHAFDSCNGWSWYTIYTLAFDIGPLHHGLKSTLLSLLELSYPFLLKYPTWIGFAACTIWCVLVCASRIYLGMHSLWDVVVGLVFVFSLMAACVPFLNAVDDFLLTSAWSPIACVAIPVVLALLYPSGGRWSTAQGDTTLILAVGSGVALGHWVSYQYGFMLRAASPPPYNIIYPSWPWLALIIIRTVVGVCILFVTRAIFKKLTYPVACWAAGLDPRDPLTKQKLAVELPNKFVPYAAVAFNTVFIVPMVFRYLEIERETFFTEI